jgi:hypothetical protein
VTVTILLMFCVLAAVLMDSVMIHAGLASRACGRCGCRRERRILGEPVCRCS